MLMTILSVALSGWAAGPVPAADAAAAETIWPQWRGPQRNARVTAAAAWPANLEGLRRVWRVPLGPGYSGPIVTADRVFVAETVDRQKEVVRALDRHSGTELWRAEWSGAMKVPFFARSNGDWIRATPCTDGESLYVAGMRDVLVCLDTATGQQRWRVDFMQRDAAPLPAFGMVCSPLVRGEHLYVQAGGGFVKLDKRTGKTLWRTMVDGGGMNSAFSSPIWAELHGRPQLVVQSRQTLAGVDPQSGKVLWSQEVPSFRGMNILTPTVHGQGILTSTYKNRTFFYDIERQGDAFAVRETWTNKVKGYMSSPVIIGEFAYLHLGNGRLSCLDLRNGETRWRSESFGKYWSMAANGPRILALDQLGELLLIDADPQSFRLLDRKEIADQETWGHIAVSGAGVFVRELEAITAFTWK